MRISFVTYGGSNEKKYSDLIPGIRILCNIWGLPKAWYEKWLPLLHGPILRSAHLFKTNQTPGADIALRAAKIWRKPLVARCGYMWSALAESFGKRRAQEAIYARRVESQVFRSAERVVVTTDRMRKYALEHYRLSDSKIRVIPNYVLTDVFVPPRTQAVRGRLCFVGRFSEEKNPIHLVRACAGLDVELMMIGEGPLKERLQKTARELGVRLKLTPNIPHKELPNALGSCELFVMASPSEGHPKALLEAMSCGLPVVAVHAPGVSDLIEHGRTGWLCGQDISEMTRSVSHLLGAPDLRKKLGSEARRFVCERFSLGRILSLELGLINEIVRGPSLEA